MKKLLFLLILPLLMCCTHEVIVTGGDNSGSSGNSDSSGDSNFYMHIYCLFNFVPVDADGANLLQAENPYTIDDLDIVLYDAKGKPYYFYDRFLATPKNIAITGEWGGNDWVCVYLNGPDNDNSNISSTHLRVCDKVHIVKGEWEISHSEFDEDNPKGSGGSSAVVTKIWFDDELVYDPDESLEIPQIIFKSKK